MYKLTSKSEMALTEWAVNLKKQFGHLFSDFNTHLRLECTSVPKVWVFGSPYTVMHDQRSIQCGCLDKMLEGFIESLRGNIDKTLVEQGDFLLLHLNYYGEFLSTLSLTVEDVTDELSS